MVIPQRNKERFIENLARNVREMIYSARLLGQECESGRVEEVSKEELHAAVKQALATEEGFEGLMTIIETEIDHGRGTVGIVR